MGINERLKTNGVKTWKEKKKKIKARDEESVEWAQIHPLKTNDVTTA